MTTYLDLQTAGSHMYPFEYSKHSVIAHLAKLMTRVNNAMAQSKADRQLSGLSDHLLKDIGVERHLIAR